MTTVPHQQFGTGPDVVLLHGWGLNHIAWQPWLPAIEQHYRLHLVDLPGFGQSAWPFDGIPSLEIYAQWLLAHLPQKATLVGWSLGGLVALALAKLAPHRVNGLLLITTSACFYEHQHWPYGTPLAILNAFGEAFANNPSTVLHDFIELQIRQTLNISDTERQRWLWQLMHYHTPSNIGLRWGLETLSHTNYCSLLPTLTMPHHWIFGGLDKVVHPNMAKSINALRSGAQTHIIPDSAHIPFWSHPDLCAEKLASVVNGR